MNAPVDARLAAGESEPARAAAARVEGLVLAAGASTRMGTPKAGLLVPGSSSTFLDRLVSTLLESGLPRVTIVTGAHAEHVRAAWHPPVVLAPRVRFVHNADWADGQLRSLQRGLASLADAELDAVLVALVDIPLVSSRTVRRLIDEWARTRAPIVRPARGDEHGHPVIFGRQLFGPLSAADPTQGAKPVVRAHAAAIVEVIVDDEGAFRDFDTPEDVKRASEWVERPRGTE